LIADKKLPSRAQTFLKRTGYTEWTESDAATALKTRYKKPFPYANGIMVAEFASLA
jgi:hypothetical protein